LACDELPHFPAEARQRIRAILFPSDDLPNANTFGTKESPSRSNNMGSWVPGSQVPVDQYQALVEAQDDNGRPGNVGAYMHNG